jgi:hypothetical protein
MLIPLKTAIALALALTCAAIIASASISTAQTNRSVEVIGPSYSAGDVRQLNIVGLQLGMTEQEIMASLEERGFGVIAPEQVDWDWRYSLPDQSVWGHFQFSDPATTPRRLERFSVWVRLPPSENVEAHRARLERLVASPSLWRQTTYGDRTTAMFAFGPNANATAEIDVAGLCYGDWRCRRDLNCVQLVSLVSGAVISGVISSDYLIINANDYEAHANALLQDQSFLNRDYGEAQCAIMSVH